MIWRPASTIAEVYNKREITLEPSAINQENNERPV